MFTDARSKTVVFVAHCILNQNSISDGTADYPGVIREILELLCASDVGIVQLPCPELICLGLDRGYVYGRASPVVEENTRIRGMMGSDYATGKLKRLVNDVVLQISEYLKHGFKITGIVGINRSPSCGVETTSNDDVEVEGEGVFIEALRKELDKKGIKLKMVGIKASEPEEAVKTVRDLIAGD